MNYIKLEEIGFTDPFKQEANQYEGLYAARVSSQHKDLYKVITENGEIQAKVSGKMNYSAQGSADYPAVGDWVMVDRKVVDGDNAIIHHILSRKSLFERKAAGTSNQSQIVASNIDVVFITMSLNSDFNLRRVERYLAIAWDSMAMPVIVLTKSDLCSDIPEKLAQLSTVAIGVDVVVTTSLTDSGYDELLKYVGKGKTAAFIGSSGVGKSTLVNRLLNKEVLVTGGIRDDDKGRHTTTHRQLLILPCAGVVIDTPGMREIQIEGADLSHSFSDIEDLAALCRFNDCTHKSEPNCAVKAAIEDGSLSFERFESYKKLQKELRYQDLKAKQREREKINNMFGSMNGLKQLKQVIRNNRNR